MTAVIIPMLSAAKLFDAMASRPLLRSAYSLLASGDDGGFVALASAVRGDDGSKLRDLLTPWVFNEIVKSRQQTNVFEECVFSGNVAKLDALLFFVGRRPDSLLGPLFDGLSASIWTESSECSDLFYKYLYGSCLPGGQPLMAAVLVGSYSHFFRILECFDVCAVLNKPVDFDTMWSLMVSRSRSISVLPDRDPDPEYRINTEASKDICTGSATVFEMMCRMKHVDVGMVKLLFFWSEMYYECPEYGYDIDLNACENVPPLHSLVENCDDAGAFEALKIILSAPRHAMRGIRDALNGTREVDSWLGKDCRNKRYTLLMAAFGFGNRDALFALLRDKDVDVNIHSWLQSGEGNQFTLLVAACAEKDGEVVERLLSRGDTKLYLPVPGMYDWQYKRFPVMSALEAAHEHYDERVFQLLRAASGRGTDWPAEKLTIARILKRQLGTAYDSVQISRWCIRCAFTSDVVPAAFVERQLRHHRIPFCTGAFSAEDWRLHLAMVKSYDIVPSKRGLLSKWIYGWTPAMHHHYCDGDSCATFITELGMIVTRIKAVIDGRRPSGRGEVLPFLPTELWHLIFRFAAP